MKKKLFTILLSLVMTLGLSISSFASPINSSASEKTNLQSFIQELLNKDSAKVELGLDKIALDKTISTQVDKDASLIAYRINVDKDTSIKLKYKSSGDLFGVAVSPYDLSKADLDNIGPINQEKISWLDIEKSSSDKDGSVDLELKKGDNAIAVLCTTGTYEITATKTDDLKTMEPINIERVVEEDTSIKGTGFAGAEVKVLDIDGLDFPTVKVDENNNFEVKINKATLGQMYIITMKKDGYVPQVKITQAGYKNYVFNTFTINTVKSTSQYVTGKGECDAEVSVAVGDAVIIGKSKVKNDGNYSVKLKNKYPAGTVLKVTMKRAGYDTKTKTVTIKKVFTKKLTVNTVKSTSTYVTGKGSPSSTVKAYVKGKKIGETKVSSKGTYSMKIAKQSKGTKIKVEMSKTGYATSTKIVVVK